MPDYLSKEEIRQWRSSLERITLEEYAQRLGKVVSDEKETNDIVDMVLKNTSFKEEIPVSTYQVKAEKISSLARQSFERERELSDKKAAAKSEKAKPEKPENAARAAIEKEEKISKSKTDVVDILQSSEDIHLTFKKNLTPREQAVFEHFLVNRNHIVYAKELAQVLELPRDYVYKYIKNLRAKLNEDALYNADNGGFVLKI